MRRSFYLVFITALLSLHNGYGQAPIFTELKDSSQSPRQYRQLTAILGAFPPELALLQLQLKEAKDTVIAHIHFLEGKLNGRNVVVAQTGIGKVNAAIVTALLLDHFQPKEVVFTGIAGGINPMLMPGDLVIANRTAYHDYGTITPDSMLRRATRNPFTMQENPVFFTCDSQLVAAAVNAGQGLSLEKIAGKNGTRSPRIIAGTIVTGDVFVASRAATEQFRTQLQADATEMEGAAVAQACWQQRVPFIIIRSLSDDAGNNASTDVRSFYEIAARNSAKLVMALMERLAR
ncbi:MAG TPA: 5'-methylthioadenosine/adenosylhomocysteine nucleosidase [Chitinophagaceae bacterium]|nr:5'-methylthioadenosine/adenosylhomocysteine nucleosidase [Chitinophagaceae bacterium]